MKTSSSQAGLTLIEVLIALVIVAIAFGALLQSTRNTITGYQYLREKVGARLVATNILTMRELRTLKTEMDRAQQGRESLFDQEWYWSMTETKTNQEKIHRIRVEVRVNDAEDAPVIYQLDGFVYAG